MNLHDLHTNPEDLDYHAGVELVPSLAWDKYKHNHDELKKREKLWIKDPETAYYYALSILKGPFELGEPAIAKDGWHSFMYAVRVLKGPFELGEPTIAKDAYCSYVYADKVLCAPFPLGEPALAKDAYYADRYQHKFPAA